MERGRGNVLTTDMVASSVGYESRSHSAVEPRLPGGAVASGTVFGVLAWLGMMVVFMPWAGNGLFALGIGPMAAVATLVLHIIYGAVLGAAFAKVTDANAMA